MEKDSLDLICHKLDIQASIDSISEEQFLLVLQNQVSHMLLFEFEKLMQILYRMDINEGKVQTIINFQTREQWPDAIARLILEREKERIFWREKYKNL